MSDKDNQVYKQFKRLQDAKDAREFMQKVINAYDKNKITKEKSRTLGYLIKIFIKTYETADLQEQVEDLQKIANQKKVV